ncbi:hypothetical protein NP233_g938 [Leucocoprinus birnbaumii]|uniref:Uncharacterized protein n=1 Tax=Leucocoprinus birnbaumii TaxID=56174 RepID=A0AAD5W4W2_9AGAR|nr:hypothetical protein NP233_g938 [Leucocoprinus birnbaumii]
MPEPGEQQDDKRWCECRRCGGKWTPYSTYTRHQREVEQGKQSDELFNAGRKKRQRRDSPTRQGNPSTSRSTMQGGTRTAQPTPGGSRSTVPLPPLSRNAAEASFHASPYQSASDIPPSPTPHETTPFIHTPSRINSDSDEEEGLEYENLGDEFSQAVFGDPPNGSPDPGGRNDSPSRMAQDRMNMENIPEPTDDELDDLRRMLDISRGDDIEEESDAAVPPPEADRRLQGDGPVDFDDDVRRIEQELEDVVVHRRDLKTAVEFIRLVRTASLDESSLPLSVLQRLRNPAPPSPLSTFDDPGLMLSLHMFLATLNASQAIYSELVVRLSRCFPEFDIYSLYRITKQIELLSGSATMVHDMCPNSCVAFTGPFADLDKCPEPRCGQSRWDSIQLSKGKRVAAKTFSTIAVGPQLQALFANRDSAVSMQYRQQKTRETLEKCRDANGRVKVDLFDDIYSGSEYLRLTSEGKIDDDSILLLLSIDGAQLYEHKASDCWIYVWVVLDMDPSLRYKKRYILPGGFIPGPKKPKNLDSFLFPGLHHISALQKEGLKVWDASKGAVILKHVLILFKTADAPAMALISGQVGHSGAKGCRRYCEVPTRLKPGGNHYYPVLLLPEGDIALLLPDIDLSKHSPYFSQEKYDTNLLTLLRTQTNAQYEDARRETGISKPSIFSGLALQAFGVPGGFPVDIMHLISLNITDLFMALWRGTIKCDAEDNKLSWDWVVLTGRTWKEHGERVAKLRNHLPSTYDRPPRNPAEKLNSGYKATEFNTYFYGYLPALLRGVLPTPYLQNFYKLVRGVRIVLQRRVTRADLMVAHNLFISFLVEFEELYVCRKPYRMHFVRQCMHVLWHLVPETFRYGPPCNFAQWTIERMIGILGSETRLHSNPYANLAKRGILLAMINALLIQYPELNITSHSPRGSISLSNNYTLLRPSDRSLYMPGQRECQALEEYFQFQVDVPRFLRYGCLKLPNGQTTRSAWREDMRKSPRPNRYVKLTEKDQNGTLSPIDTQVLEETYNVLFLCTFTRYETLQVFPVEKIDSIVALLPYNERQFFVVEELGLAPEDFEAYQEDMEQ